MGQNPIPANIPDNTGPVAQAADIWNAHYGRPEWQDETIPLGQRLESFLHAHATGGYQDSPDVSEQHWAQVQASLQQHFPGVNPAGLRQPLQQIRQNQQTEARTALALQQHTGEMVDRPLSEGGPAWLQRIGSWSTLGDSGHRIMYNAARENIAAGHGTAADFNRVAEFDARQQFMQHQGLPFHLVEGLGRLSNMALEAYAGGRVLGAIGAGLGSAGRGVGLLRAAAPTATAGIETALAAVPRAGPPLLSSAGLTAALRALPGAAARNAATTASIPSMYAPGIAEQMTEHPDRSFLANAAAGYGLGYIQTAILGTIGHQAGRLIPGSNLSARLGRLALQVPVGMTEQQLADTLGTQLGLQSGYGLIGQLARGENGEALQNATVQSMMFTIFGLMHGSERPNAIMEAQTRALQQMRRGGLSRSVAGERVNGVLDAVVQRVKEYADMSRQQAVDFIDTLHPSGPLRDFGLALANAFPEHQQAMRYTQPVGPPRTLAEIQPPPAAPQTPAATPKTTAAPPAAPTAAQPAPGRLPNLSDVEVKQLAKGMGLSDKGDRQTVIGRLLSHPGGEALIQGLEGQQAKPVSPVIQPEARPPEPAHEPPKTPPVTTEAAASQIHSEPAPVAAPVQPARRLSPIERMKAAQEKKFGKIERPTAEQGHSAEGVRTAQDAEFDRAGLNERERTIIARRRAGHALEDIAHDFDLTRERIRQIERDAQKKLGKEGSVQTELEAQTDRLVDMIENGKAAGLHDLGTEQGTVLRDKVVERLEQWERDHNEAAEAFIKAKEQELKNVGRRTGKSKGTKQAAESSAPAAGRPNENRPPESLPQTTRPAPGREEVAAPSAASPARPTEADRAGPAPAAGAEPAPAGRGEVASGLSPRWQHTGTKFSGDTFQAKNGQAYRISAEHGGEVIPWAEVKVRDVNGNEVGSAKMQVKGNEYLATGLDVEPEHRRQGIAQAMYDWLTERHGRVRRSPYQTESSSGLWDKNAAGGQVPVVQATSGLGIVERQFRSKGERMAKEAGLDPQHVHHLAGELMQTRAATNAEINEVIRDSYDQLKEHGSSHQSVRHALDADQVKGLDEVADYWTARRPDLVPDSDALYQLLKDGIRKPDPQADYESAIRTLEAMHQPEVQHAIQDALSEHSAAEVAETIRAAAADDAAGKGGEGQGGEAETRGEAWEADHPVGDASGAREPEPWDTPAAEQRTAGEPAGANADAGGRVGDDVLSAVSRAWKDAGGDYDSDRSNSPEIVHDIAGVMLGRNLTKDEYNSAAQSLHKMNRNVPIFADAGGFGQPVSEAERSGATIGGGQSDAAESRRMREIALANEVNDKQRIKDGKEPIMRQAQQADPVLWGKAMERLAADPQAGEKLVDEINKNPRPATAEETLLLLHRQVAVRNELDRAYLDGIKAFKEKASAAVQDALELRIKQLDALRDASDRAAVTSGSEAGRAFRLRRLLMAEDYSMTGLLRQKEAALGRPLSEAEKQQVADLHKKIGDLEGKLAALEAAGKVKPGQASDTGFDLAQLKAKFGRELEADRWARAPWKVKAMRLAGEVISLPRSLMSSIDFPLLRQGLVATLSHPIRTGRAVPGMFLSFFSEKAAERAQYELEHRPNAALYKAAGLDLTSRFGPLSAHEEGFMSRLINKIPIIGHIVQGSERSFQTIMNRLRADAFDAMVGSLARNGKVTTAEAKVVANYVNVMTGRGSLGGAEKAGVVLNHIFFAPKWAISRFQFLLGQPIYGHLGLDAGRARLAVAKEYARFATGLGVVAGLAVMAGFDLEKDPRSAQFGKLRIGNTRLDLTGGLSSAGRLLAQTFTLTNKNTRDQLESLHGPVQYGRSNYFDVLARFLRGKLAPAPGAILNLLAGTDVVGNPVTPQSQAANLVTPLYARDVYESMLDLGVPKATAISLLGLLGMGMNTYSSSANHSPVKAR